jgi:hypothetical protein
MGTRGEGARGRGRAKASTREEDAASQHVRMELHQAGRWCRQLQTWHRHPICWGYPTTPPPKKTRKHGAAGSPAHELNTHHAHARRSSTRCATAFPAFPIIARVAGVHDGIGAVGDHLEAV